MKGYAGGQVTIDETLCHISDPSFRAMMDCQLHCLDGIVSLETMHNRQGHDLPDHMAGHDVQGFER